MNTNDLDTEYLPTYHKTENLTSNLSLLILLNNLFIKNHSKFSSFDDLVYHCDYSINSTDVFLALPDDTVDTYIKNISYDSWEEMLGDAVAAYVEQQLSHWNAL